MKYSNKKNIPSEHEEQKALINKCKQENIFIFAIPNGVHLKKDYAQLNKLKAEGLINGIPDLFIPQYYLFIEMKKREGGIVSKEQQKCHECLRSYGYTVIVAKGAKCAWQAIQESKINEFKRFNR